MPEYSIYIKLYTLLHTITLINNTHLYKYQSESWSIIILSCLVKWEDNYNFCSVCCRWSWYFQWTRYSLCLLLSSWTDSSTGIGWYENYHYKAIKLAYDYLRHQYRRKFRTFLWTNAHQYKYLENKHIKLHESSTLTQSKLCIFSWCWFLFGLRYRWPLYLCCMQW